MPDEDDGLFDDDDDEIDLQDPELFKKLRSQIRSKNKDLKQLQEQANAGLEAQKRLALLDAKLPDTPQIKFFLDNYNGEYTADAIRQKATEFGFLTEENNRAEEEVNQVGEIMGASMGSTTTPPGADQEVIDAINAIPPGPQASKRVEAVLKQFGRYVSDEE